MTDSEPLSALLPSYLLTLEARQRSPRTIELAELYVSRLISWLKSSGHSEQAADISSRRIEEYLVHLKSDLSPTTVRIHYRTVRAFFGWLAVEEEIDSNPFKKLQQPKAEDKPVPIFTQAELAALVDVCKGRGFEQRRDRAILFTLIDTGIRLGELAEMTVENLHLGTRTALVDGKTGSRVVPFGPTSIEVIDRYMRVRRSHTFVDRPELWLGTQGPLGRSGISQILKRRGRQAGLEGVNPHRFRHTFCHDWLAGGGNEVDLQHIVGWTSTQMLQRYARSTAADRALDAHQQFSPANKLR